MLRVAVLVSGGGTNLQAIIDKIYEGYMPEVEICAVISSKSDAFAIERAKKSNIPVKVIARKEYKDSIGFTDAIVEYMQSINIDLVVLAGFMHILDDVFIKKYENRILNVHPSLIPSFCGKGYYGLVPHQKALEQGVKVTGATVHFVTAECDGGPIILQKAVYVKDEDTAESLQKRVMEEAEWEILPEAIKLISENRLTVENGKVKIKNKDMC